MKSKSPKDRTTHRLTEQEAEGLTQTISEALRKYDLASACVYGSRVAGYAKSHSDYDIIAVIDEYAPKVRYKYIKGDLAVAALLVDKDALIADAEKGALGEFVVGRLLNTYEVLDGDKYFKDIEVKYKKRVILETLNEIISIYGDFSTALTIPVEYFLYEKLKKRAAIYPPALYSYTNTYTGKQAKENLQATLSGFGEALHYLHDEGLIFFKNGDVGIKKAILRHRQLTRIKTILTDTTRGLTQYAVHGYAGRVGWDVVGREVMSKIGRSKTAGEVPEQLRHPKYLWRIDEGLLIMGGNGWLPQLAEHIGLRKHIRVTRRHLGELYNITYIYVLHQGNRKVSLAVKKFKDLKSLKWAFLNFWALPAKRFYTAPLARLYREYTAIKTFRDMGLDTPKVVGVALNDMILITEFIEGVDLSKIIADILQNRAGKLQAIHLYGESLGKIHSEGYSLGDTKPSNTIYHNSKVYLTDLEQASIGGDQSWDLAEFLYYSSKLTLNTIRVKEITEAFLDGYLKYGSANIIEKALNAKYLAPFQPLLAPMVVKSVREEMIDKAGVKGQYGLRLTPSS